MAGELEHMINKAITALGTEVFELANHKVPVVTGQLKASGSLVPLYGGFEIAYTASYAEDVELGVNGRQSTASPDSGLSGHHAMIPRHVRRTKKGKVPVKAHVKKFTASKPVRLKDGTWRTFGIGDAKPAFKGRHFLGNALEEVLMKRLTLDSGLQIHISGTIKAKD